MPDRFGVDRLVPDQRFHEEFPFRAVPESVSKGFWFSGSPPYPGPEFPAAKTKDVSPAAWNVETLSAQREDQSQPVQSAPPQLLLAMWASSPLATRAS